MKLLVNNESPPVTKHKISLSFDYMECGELCSVYKSYLQLYSMIIMCLLKDVSKSTVCNYLIRFVVGGKMDIVN